MTRITYSRCKNKSLIEYKGIQMNVKTSVESEIRAPPLILLMPPEHHLYLRGLPA
jgi:hypothetical protein